MKLDEVAPPKVISYDQPHVEAAMTNGKMNVEEGVIVRNIASSIRRGHPQWRPGPPRPERLCLVGSGPSLNDPEVFEELRQLVWEGAVLVTMNGAYLWCLERGLRPQTQIVMDARESNSRFVQPFVPRCNYVIASQCAPSVWDALENREHVWIFHAVVKKEGASSDLLDSYYAENWVPVGGGTTVATRAINLLRIAGYLRFDLFGVDCCWRGQVHHALPQPENEKDQYVIVRAGVRELPETMREFRVSPWQLKQAEDLLTVMQVNGQHFMLQSHGDGMFTHLMQMLGRGDSLTIEKE